MQRPPHRTLVLLVLLAIAVLALVLVRGSYWYFDPRRSNRADQIIVYSTAWCPVCKRLRVCLERERVPFEERDVEKSWRAGAEYSALEGTGVPLTLAGQRIAYGMRQEELREALGGAGYRVECWGSTEPSRIAR